MRKAAPRATTARSPSQPIDAPRTPDTRASRVCRHSGFTTQLMRDCKGMSTLHAVVAPSSALRQQFRQRYAPAQLLNQKWRPDRPPPTELLPARIARIRAHLQTCLPSASATAFKENQNAVIESTKLPGKPRARLRQRKSRCTRQPRGCYQP